MLFIMIRINSLKYIFILIILILILILYFNQIRENFNINLEKQYSLYQDYRNFIDGNDYLLLKYNPAKRNFPYKISTNCFVDKFQRCKYIGKYKTQANNKIVDKLCEDISLDQCVIP